MRVPALVVVVLLAAPAWADEGVDAGTPTTFESAADAGLSPEPEVTPAPVAPAIGTPEAPPSALAEAFAHHVETNGYLSARGGFSRARATGLIPTNDLPQLTGLVELNGQVKVKYLERSFVYGDLSLIAQAGTMFRGRNDADGTEVEIADHDVASLRPAVSLNELYVLHEFLPELNLMVGKKRLVWGSGQAYNPTDLLNIRKDPTDPTFQRAGAWLARIEVPLEKFAFTAVFAPQTVIQQNGLPQQFLTWPTWSKTARDPKDDQVHYLLALRAYALIADADVNLMLYFSNLYNDSFKDKVRFGGSFSRYFFTDYELHTEFLIGTGSGRDYVTHDCVTTAMAALGCATGMPPTAFISKSRLDDSNLYGKVLFGTRRQFDDESLLSIEYLYQGDGLNRVQYQDQVNALDLIQQAKMLGVPANQIPSLGTTSSTDGIPQRFTFDPVARHYLFVTYNKPRIFDDFTAQLVMIANLQDLSTLWSPSISWSTTEWLTLSVIGFFPAPGLDSLSATRLSPQSANSTIHDHVSEYGIFPVAYRALLEARIFF